MVELLTASDSERQQRAVAGALLARGLRAGDRFVMLTESSAAMLSAIMGGLRVGIVPVVLNSALLRHERDLLMKDADPKLLVDDRELELLLDGVPAELAEHPLARPMHYTSGTTGVPKGVWSGVLGDEEGRALLAEERDLWGLTSTDRQLICSPLHHSVAIRFAATTLLAGGDVVILGRFEARVAARAITELRPTCGFMVPAHLQRLFALDQAPDLGCFRQLVHAGAPCPESLKLAAIRTVGADSVWEFYGSTEGQFTACSAAEWLDHRGTVGRARPGRVLWAEEGRGEGVGGGVDGDIDPGGAGVKPGTVWCRAPRYARWEYWRDPDRTGRAWRRTPTGDAFTVGDLGRIDGDGFLYLDGRRDDLIITGGVNVYPVEVERALAGAPGVGGVGVFGVDDERWGQRVCAAVVPDPSSAPADIDQLHAYARSKLAPFKCPKDIYLIDELPHTATGKLQRLRLPDVVGL